MKGVPAPITASSRWPVERTNTWTNAHKKLVWCTERRAGGVAFWLAFSGVVIIVRRLIREGTAGTGDLRANHEPPAYWRRL